jgi:branched-chain amino acid transport system ATP-binding protein
MIIFETKGLSRDFGGLKALEKVDLAIREGELFGLIGPNGSGKTTCFNLITGFLKPSAGLIVYQGSPITGLKPFQIAAKGIIRTFQITSLFPDLSCEENIIIGRYLRTKGSIWGAMTRSKKYRTEEKQTRKKAVEILDFVGMGKNKDVLAKNLPFGEERKLEIAIALATEPKLLLLDEPAAGMSPEESTSLMNLVRSFKEMGITVLIVEHNMKVVMGLCDRIAVLNYGVKIAEGDPDAIANNDEVTSVYIGRSSENA